MVTPLYVAEMVTVLEAVTVRVVIRNVAVLSRVSIVTLAGTVATAVLDDVSVTVEAATAAPVSKTCPVTRVPPCTGEVAVTELKTAGLTVKFTRRVTPAKVAEMPAVADALTARVVTVKFAERAPPGTVTEAGTVAAAVFELASVTTVPAAGAAALKVTFPVALTPPFTGFGVRERAVSDTVAAVTVSVADLVTPAKLADTVTLAVADCA